MGRTAARWTGRGGAVTFGLVTALALVLASSVVAIGHSSPQALAAPAPDELLPLHATRGDAPGIFDAAGRQVLLRAVNVNALGDYYQANPAYPTVIPLTDADLDEMAAGGFNAIRLLVSWSRLEPERGSIDLAYVDEVLDLVRRAGARGIYSIIDMHQDAWGKYIASPPGVVCGPGLEPAIGWDGAPSWATITDGADTCRSPGNRESSEAVRTAWDSFYADRDGIMSHLVSAWRVLANAVAHEPSVAGYDLLNEPGVGHDNAASIAGLGTFFARAIEAIRAGEGDASDATHVAVHRPAFFETTVFGGAVPFDFTTDSNIVFAPHNYGESILGVPLEIVAAFFRNLAGQYRTAMWTGEYGWFGDPAGNQEKLVRFARTEDAAGSSSAWWQWVQACGDPHSIGSPGGTPASVLVHLHRSTCPGDDVERPALAEWDLVLSRPFPRATPGRLLSLASDGATRSLRLVGEVGAGQVAGASTAATLDVWVPDGRGVNGVPSVAGEGLDQVTVTPVPGGFRIQAQVCGRYELRLAAVPEEATTSSTLPPPAVDPAACRAAPPPSAVSSTTRPASAGASSGPGVATAVRVTPRFTG